MDMNMQYLIAGTSPSSSAKAMTFEGLSTSLIEHTVRQHLR